jgi:hypothetical protein
MHARLCGGGDLLKAPSSVASYLADRLFNLSNDKQKRCDGRGQSRSKSSIKLVQTSGVTRQSLEPVCVYHQMAKYVAYRLASYFGQCR